MPRWQRMGKRLLLVLLATCVTIKVHLDLKLLSQPTSTSYSLWLQRNNTQLLKSHQSIRNDGSSNSSNVSVLRWFLEVTAIRPYHNVGLNEDLTVFHDLKYQQKQLLQHHQTKNETWGKPENFKLEESKKGYQLNTPKRSTKWNIQKSNNSSNWDVNDKVDGIIGIADNANIQNEVNVPLKKIAKENQVFLTYNKESPILKNNGILKETELKYNVTIKQYKNISNGFNKLKEMIKVLNVTAKIDKRDTTINSINLLTNKTNNINSEEHDKPILSKKINVLETLIQNKNVQSEWKTNKSQYIEQDKISHDANTVKSVSAKHKSDNSEINQNENASKSPLVDVNIQNELYKRSTVNESHGQGFGHANKTKMYSNTKENIKFGKHKESDLKTENNNEGMHTVRKENNNLSKTHIKSENSQNEKDTPSKLDNTSNNVPESLHKIKQQVNPNDKIITKSKESLNNPGIPHHIPMKIHVTNRKPKSPAALPAARAPTKNTHSKGVAVSHKIDQIEMSLTDAEIANISMVIQHINNDQLIFNLDKFGPITNDTVVFLIQVHTRLVNLQHLVESLKAAQGINSSLVIFSHDLWHTGITTFIKSITSFRHMQMFFPFSIQLNPRTFPGRDPRDCSWNIHRNPNLKCLNREWPDSYGHFREAGFTQIKHHWWWKIYRLFEEVRVLRGGTWLGQVVFLEEDHVVSPDILYVLKLMNQERPHLCPSCNVITLGNYNKLAPSSYQNIVEAGDWWVTKYNLGFVLDYRVWLSVKACGVQFCEYDDYNWDWTLSSLIHSCIKPKLTMFSIKFSRVMHVGSCGTHVRKSNCDIGKEVAIVNQRYKTGQQWLFPKTLKIQGAHRGSQKPKKGNGGWGDFRDKMLCRAMSSGSATQNTIKSLQFLQQQENR